MTAARRSRQDSLDTSRTQTPPAKPADAAYPPIGPGEVAQVLGRAVGGVVVNEDSFPVDPIEQPIEPVDQRADIVALVKRRNDNGEVWPGLPWFSKRRSPCKGFSLRAEQPRRARRPGHITLLVIRPIRESPLVVLANAGTHCSVTSEFSSNGNTYRSSKVRVCGTMDPGYFSTRSEAGVQSGAREFASSAAVPSNKSRP